MRIRLWPIGYLRRGTGKWGAPDGLLLFGKHDSETALAFDTHSRTPRIVAVERRRYGHSEKLGSTLAEALSKLEEYGCEELAFRQATKLVRAIRASLNGGSGRHRVSQSFLRGKGVTLGDYIGFVPTPMPVVHRMLELAGLRPGETLYDLGCGDGRILIMAARHYNARGRGIDIDPERIEDTRQRVRKAGLSRRITLRCGNIFRMDLRGADVVTLYLLTSLNEN